MRFSEVLTGAGSVLGSKPELAGQGRRVVRIGIVTALGGAAGAAVLLLNRQEGPGRAVPGHCQPVRPRARGAARPERLPMTQMRGDRNHVFALIGVSAVTKFLHISGHSGLLCASESALGVRSNPGTCGGGQLTRESSYPARE